MTKEEAKEFYNNTKNVKMEFYKIENDDKDEYRLYNCNNYYNYFYGVMPMSTGYINVIDIKKI